jgi:hypothetical protein
MADPRVIADEINTVAGGAESALAVMRKRACYDGV